MLRRRGTKCDCKIDWLWVRSPLEEIKYLLAFIIYFNFFALVSRQSATLSSATQHAMRPELGGNWGMECLNTRFPLPTLLCVGYSVKLIYFIYKNNIIYWSNRKYVLNHTGYNQNVRLVNWWIILYHPLKSGNCGSQRCITCGFN